MSEALGVFPVMLFPPPEMAADIMTGLVSGRLERIGGVIRDAISKQIICWLRDGEGASQTSRLLDPLTQFTAATSVINLSIATAGFILVIKRLDVIEQQLKVITRLIKGLEWKIEAGFYAEANAGLDMAANAYTMKQGDNRNKALTAAIMSLFTAEQQFTALLTRELASRERLAPMLLNTLLLIHYGIARCYAEMEELGIASSHLTKHVEELRKSVGDFRDIVLGPCLSVYLHPDLAEEISLVRLAWLLKQADPDITPTALFERIRRQLWDTAEEGPKAWVKGLPSWMTERMTEETETAWQKTKNRVLDQSEREWQRAKKLMPNALQQVEEVYEGLNRLQGFASELDYLADHKRSFAEWQTVKPLDGEASPYYCMVPPESSEYDRVERAKQRLSANSSQDSTSQPNTKRTDRAASDRVVAE